jgi:hypothetical protein
MANFIYDRQWLDQGDVVIVECDHQCHIRVTDDQNCDQFRKGLRHRYYGGFYRLLPARIVVPSSGNWNVSLDMGGKSANIKYQIKYKKAASHIAAA